MEGFNIILYSFLFILFIYLFIYFRFLNKYKDLKYLFFINKSYDFILLWLLLFKIRDSDYFTLFYFTLIFINLISIVFIIYKVLKNKEQKRKIIYGILSHSEFWLFYVILSINYYIFMIV